MSRVAARLVSEGWRLRETERPPSLPPAYVCALQKEVPYHGRLYLTEAHACFYSSVLLKDTKVNRGFTRCH